MTTAAMHPAADARAEPDLAAPDPNRFYPNLFGPKGDYPVDMQRVVFLKPLIQSRFTSVGDYTYYDDPGDPTGFERNNVLFHFGPDRLEIGKYCALATGVLFVMSAANHPMTGISTYPFPLMGGAWAKAGDLWLGRPARGDTVVGSDTWIGREAVVMPGVKIGPGAVIAARTVVSSDVPPYAVVAGNPGRLVRHRFGDEDIHRLLRIAWWDWPVEQVTRHLRTIMAGCVDELEAVAREQHLLT